MGASGISSGFPGLSQSLGQVAHVLRTRSPLGLPQGCPWLDPVRLACVKHAASVRPEPGSNSPSRSWTPPKRSRDQKSRSSRALTRWTNWHRNVNIVIVVRFSALTLQPLRLSRATRLPALVFGYLCSVFKEHRSWRHAPTQIWVGVGANPPWRGLRAMPVLPPLSLRASILLVRSGFSPYAFAAETVKRGNSDLDRPCARPE